MIPRWLFWTLVTLLAWGIWAILGKLIGDHLSPAHSQVISTAGVFPIIIALMFMAEEPPKGNRTRGIFLALSSGVVSSLGNIYFYKLLNSSENAATVIPLAALYPLVTVVLAVLLLKERLNWIQILGIGLSLVAIYLFNMQDERGMDLRRLAGVLLPIVLWGLTGFLQKLSTYEISARSSAICFLIAFIPVAGWIVLRDPLPHTIDGRLWSLTLALGFTLALGNLTILLAYASDGKASIITPLAGLYPLISVPIAIVALGERISVHELLGIASALLAVAMLSMESTLANRDAPPLKPN